MVPAHIVLGRREERGVVYSTNIMRNLTGLYPMVAEHPAMEAVGRFNWLSIVKSRFSTYSHSLLQEIGKT